MGTIKMKSFFVFLALSTTVTQTAAGNVPKSPVEIRLASNDYQEDFADKGAVRRVTLTCKWSLDEDFESYDDYDENNFQLYWMERHSGNNWRAIASYTGGENGMHLYHGTPFDTRTTYTVNFDEHESTMVAGLTVDDDNIKLYDDTKSSAKFTGTDDLSIAGRSR